MGGPDSLISSFTLPFLVIGSLHFVSGFLTNWIVLSKKPSVSEGMKMESPEEAEGAAAAAANENRSPLAFFQLLTLPAVLLFSTTVILNGANLGLLIGNGERVTAEKL